MICSSFETYSQAPTGLSLKFYNTQLKCGNSIIHFDKHFKGIDISYQKNIKTICKIIECSKELNLTLSIRVHTLKIHFSYYFQEPEILNYQLLKRLSFLQFLHLCSFDVYSYHVMYTNFAHD